jgi:Tfp pilus assembly PilM family ATPase
LTSDQRRAIAVRLSPAVVGIDIGKNSFHVVGLDERGATRSATIFFMQKVPNTLKDAE